MFAAGSPRPSKDRASVACRRCHAKKVRCSAAEQMPCAGCVMSGSDCVLIDSRRGKYPRKMRAPSQQAASLPNAAPRESRGKASPRGHAAHHVFPGQRRQSDGNVGVHDFTERVVPATANDIWPAMEGSRSGSSHDDSPASLYAQVAERSVDADEFEIQKKSEEYMFLGETFSLTYVVHDVLAPFIRNTPIYPRRLQFPITIADGRPRTHSNHPSKVAADQLGILKEHSLLPVLDAALSDRLLGLYLRRFHPAFPIVDISNYTSSEIAGQHSQLVWNAMMMLAVTLCDDETLKDGGFKNHHQARAVFYKRARCLYDADAEPDALDTIRGCFLMSFWWGGPNEIKDSKHWLGNAITLAQSRGLHRTTRSSNIDPVRASAWKRVWWCLRVRDVLISASIGRPTLASQIDCDVELPGLIDVSDQIPFGNEEEQNYFIFMAMLSDIVVRIIEARYACANFRPARDNQLSLESALSEFANQLPMGLRYNGVQPVSCQGLWAAMLFMAHNYATILLCRAKGSRTGHEQPPPWGNPRKAISAANDISRVTEDLLSASMIGVCQVHMIMALFNALAMHVYAICTSQTLARNLAEARARMCMIGLSALQASWPVGGWVLKLFDSIMSRLPQLCNTDTPRRGNDPPLEKHAAPIDTSGHIYVQQGGPHTPVSTTSRTDATGVILAERYAGRDRTTTGEHAVIDTDLGYGADMVVSEWDLGLNFHMMPNIFAFDDATAGWVSDQNAFFDLLDITTIIQPDRHTQATRNSSHTSS